MKKIPTFFKRDMSKQPALVTPEVTPGCGWVLQGEGNATRKFDGTCAMVRGGKLFKRHELKPGKVAPDGFEDIESDLATGKTVGWVPVCDGPEDKWFRDAELPIEDGTYELCGPKVQGDPERCGRHIFVPHGKADMLGVPTDFDGLRAFLRDRDIEGIVWWHSDGRKAKIKKKDFGFKR